MLIEENKVMKCPSCGREHVVKCGFTRQGVQRFRCQDCKYRFVQNPQKVHHERHDIKCPNCSYSYAKKAGKSGDGKQYYICLKCNHKFLQYGKYRHLTKEQKKLIIMYNLNLGVSKKQIAEYLEINHKTVYNVIREFKEKLEQGVKDGRKR